MFPSWSHVAFPLRRCHVTSPSRRTELRGRARVRYPSTARKGLQTSARREIWAKVDFRFYFEVVDPVLTLTSIHRPTPRTHLNQGTFTMLRTSSRSLAANTSRLVVKRSPCVCGVAARVAQTPARGLQSLASLQRKQWVVRLGVVWERPSVGERDPMLELTGLSTTFFFPFPCSFPSAPLRKDRHGPYCLRSSSELVSTRPRLFLVSLFLFRSLD
jgi:hypothetical protein